MNNNNTLLIILISLLIGGTGGYVISGMSMSHTMMGNGNNNSGKGMMCEGMEMDHGMIMVTGEKEFITEMIPHHQEAVDTAKQVLARGGTTPGIKTLMENIITAQEKEIADMKSWFQAWYDTPYQPSGNYKPMMRDLSNLSGKEIDKVFLEDMVMHHMGAIMMAHSVQGYIEHNEVRNLTKAIITSQSDEIVQMRKMRVELQ